VAAAHVATDGGREVDAALRARSTVAHQVERAHARLVDVLPPARLAGRVGAPAQRLSDSCKGTLNAVAEVKAAALQLVRMLLPSLMVSQIGPLYTALLVSTSSSLATSTSASTWVVSASEMQMRQCCKRLLRSARLLRCRLFRAGAHKRRVVRDHRCAVAVGGAASPPSGSCSSARCNSPQAASQRKRAAAGRTGTLGLDDLLDDVDGVRAAHLKRERRAVERSEEELDVALRGGCRQSIVGRPTCVDLVRRTAVSPPERSQATRRRKGGADSGAAVGCRTPGGPAARAAPSSPARGRV